MSRVTGAPLQSERVQLEQILNQYRPGTTLNSTMSHLVDDPAAHEDFVTCIQHDISILSTRSQQCGSYECSTTQKALVILMNKERNLVAAANLYAEEILGFSGVPGDAEGLKAQIKAKKVIIEGMYPSLKDRTPNNGILLIVTGLSLLAIPRSAPMAVAPLPQNDVSSSADQVPQNPQECDDPKFARLWGLYIIAKEQLAAIPETEIRSYANAAKFLRDTIENCIDYLIAKHHSPSTYRSRVCGSEAQMNPDRKLLGDLQIAFKEAKEAADIAYDRPRRFEEMRISRSQLYRMGPTYRDTVSDTLNQKPNSGRAGPCSTNMGRYEVKNARSYQSDPRQPWQDLRRSASPKGRRGHRDAQYGHRVVSGRLGKNVEHGDEFERFPFRECDSYKPSY